MRRILAFDTETWQRKDGDTFRLGVIWDGERAHVFHDRHQMAEAFRRREWEGAWFFAHNLAYDLQSIWGLEWPGRTCLIHGQVYFTRIQVRKHTYRQRRVNGRTMKKRTQRRYVQLADTTRHFQGKLTKLAAHLGMEKLYPDLEDFDGLGVDELVARCTQDARIVYEWAAAIQETYNGLSTSLNYTAGSSAVECYRRTAMQRPYVQLDQEHLVDLNRCYYGGRTEAYYVGELAPGTYHLADVVSMYPSVMRELVMPVPSREHCWRSTDPRPWMLGRPGGSRVRVRVPYSMYPPLPYRAPKTGKLLFPYGTMEGWWTHLELAYAVDQGCDIIEHKEAVWFDATERPFRSFIDSLFAIKARGGMLELTAKLMMNSTYGKFGQCRPAGTMLSQIEWLEFAAECPDEAKELVLSGSVSEYRDDAGRVLSMLIQKDDLVFPKHSNQIWAAMITAAARVKLHGLLVELEGIYCDTDSVLTRKPVHPAKDLGALDHKATVTGGVILGPKSYAFQTDDGKGLRALKGVPARRGWYRDKSLAVWWECENVRDRVMAGFEIAYDAPMKILEGLRRDHVPSLIPTGHVASDGITRAFAWGPKIKAKPNIWFPHRKSLRLENDKRVVLDSGWTRPLRVR